MYEEIGTVPEKTIAGLRALLKDAKWETHESEVTSHQASPCPVPEELKSFGERGLFLRLRSGGNLYRHKDTGYGYHVPVETNNDCISLSYGNPNLEQRLEVGKIYHCDRSIEHESFNRGTTNRTHLIILKE